MTDTTYNGWTNYETWCVNLWLDNDQGSYNYWRAIADECWADSKDCDRVARGVWTREESARFDLADRLKAEIEESIPEDLSSNMFGDLLGAALSEVNWDEMAEHYIADVDKDSDDDSDDE